MLGRLEALVQLQRHLVEQTEQYGLVRCTIEWQAHLPKYCLTSLDDKDEDVFIRNIESIFGRF